MLSSACSVMRKSCSAFKRVSLSRSVSIRLWIARAHNDGGPWCLGGRPVPHSQSSHASLKLSLPSVRVRHVRASSARRVTPTCMQRAKRGKSWIASRCFCLRVRHISISARDSAEECAVVHASGPRCRDRNEFIHFLRDICAVLQISLLTCHTW